MDRLSWRQIELFRGVMSAGSVTGAAALLHTSQPTVSREIAELEEELGFPLFERRSKRLFATDKGLRFFEQVKQCYLGMDQLRRAGQAIREELEDEVRVACLPLLAQTLMPRAIDRFLKTEPEARISVQTLSQIAMFQNLSNGRFSFGVVESGMTVDGTSIEEIDMGNEVVIVPPSHPLAGKSVIRLEDLASQRFIAFPHGDILRGKLDALLRESDVRMATRLEASTAEAVCAMVGRGLGVSIVNPITAHLFSTRGLVVRRLAVKIPFQVALYLPSQGRSSSIGARFAACVLQECKAMRTEIARSYSPKRTQA